MAHYYTNERNHQILIALLKAHNIQNVIASPGTTNSVFIGSIQNDDYFKIYSSVDERSAAYIACGLAYETGEPVVISCTGATAARNYMSGATEAYYSKLPILILTSSQEENRVGHLCAQVTDRSRPPRDVCKLSLKMPNVRTKDDEWECEVVCNKALLELRRRGGGPVHVNLITNYSYNEETALTAKELPPTRVIRRVSRYDDKPELKASNVAIIVGSHKPWSSKEIVAVENFCESNNAIVLTDHTSNYNGKYKIPLALSINQASFNKANTPAYSVDVLIHIGEVSGEEGVVRMVKGKETWRVSEDGEIRDPFRNMSYVFEMTEQDFFELYSSKGNSTAYYKKCKIEYDELMAMQCSQFMRMPFSNVWVAGQIAKKIPANSTVVLSILNTLRTWNYSEFKDSVRVYSPVGGFGIDGATSMMLGTSLNDTQRPCYCITGDLAFFYDLNAIGNRHISNNVRILLINNNVGVEFKKCYAMAYRLLEEEVDPYVAAAGHFGKKSPNLVKHMAEDLGFEYLSASNKEEFSEVAEKFVSETLDKPIIFEVFVNADDECVALNVIQNRY